MDFSSGNFWKPRRTQQNADPRSGNLRVLMDGGWMHSTRGSMRCSASRGMAGSYLDSAGGPSESLSEADRRLCSEQSPQVGNVEWVRGSGAARRPCGPLEPQLLLAKFAFPHQNRPLNAAPVSNVLKGTVAARDRDLVPGLVHVLRVIRDAHDIGAATSH